MDEKLGKKELQILTGTGVESNLDGNHAISFNDRESPNCLYFMVPTLIKSCLDKADIQALIIKDEDELIKIAKPTPTVNKLRIGFWLEHERAIKADCKMEMVNVWSGVCSAEYFYEICICKNDIIKNIAWILNPVQNYATIMEEGLAVANRRLRDILEMPLYEMKQYKDSKGNMKNRRIPNTKVAELIIKAHQILDTRVKGAVVQKVEQKSLNMNVTGNVPSGATDVNMSAIDVEAEIKRIEEENTSKNLSGVTDAARTIETTARETEEASGPSTT